MTTVKTFSGLVSGQAAEGGTVTITVTKPDETVDTLTAQTLADLSFSTTKDYLPGSYTAQAHIDADAQFEAADSEIVPFTILARTITLIVT